MSWGDGHVVVPLLRAVLVTPWSIDIEWDDDVAATGWRLRQTPGYVGYEVTGSPRWRATGLEPGVVYEFWVFAVDEDHGESSGNAVIRVSTVNPGPADSSGSDRAR